MVQSFQFEIAFLITSPKQYDLSEFGYSSQNNKKRSKLFN